MTEEVHNAEYTRPTCEQVVASSPTGWLVARCGHLRPCAEHDAVLHAWVEQWKQERTDD